LSTFKKKYDLAFSKLSAPACLQLHARSFTRQFEQDLPQSGFTCTSHCRHPNEGIQVGHARLRLLLRLTVQATSVEALCTLARGYPFRREKHKTCELSQHRQRSIWQPLVKNGAEKEKNTPEAGNTLAYVHEEKKRVIRVLMTLFCICATMSAPLKSFQKNGGRNLHSNICGNRCTHVGKKTSQIATFQQV
jgi:hypothetical protein